MKALFARGRRPTDDNDGRTVVNVSDVETERVDEYVSEWFADAADVYLERKGGKTLLVVGE